MPSSGNCDYKIEIFLPLTCNFKPYKMIEEYLYAKKEGFIPAYAGI